MSSAHAFQALLESASRGPLPQWEALEETVEVHSVEPGGTVFLQGVAHPYVYVVRSGLLKLCYLTEDGVEWVKSFASEGSFFASMTALRPKGRTTFTVTAIESSILERIDFRLIVDLAERHLAWSNAVQRMTMGYAARKEERERDLLTLRAHDRYLAFCAAYPNLASRIPQKDLARHLGITPVGMNRIVMRVRRGG